MWDITVSLFTSVFGFNKPKVSVVFFFFKTVAQYFASIKFSWFYILTSIRTFICICLECINPNNAFMVNLTTRWWQHLHKKYKPPQYVCSTRKGYRVCVLEGQVQ